jgi:hypothetical protein
MVQPLTYATFTNELALLAVVSPSDTNFQANLPSAINYAELRIYRDIDLLSTVMAVTGFSATANSNVLTLGEGDFVTLQNINVLTPVGQANPLGATRNPLTARTKDYLYAVWGSAAGAGLPKDMAILNTTTVLLGPWPDQNYALEIVGTIRPPSLSASNTTTWISTYMPDLLLYAAMIFISGYQRNFGLQGNDPAMGVTYESQYQTMMKSAAVEEARKKFQSSGWTSMSPAIAATPSRG